MRPWTEFLLIFNSFAGVIPEKDKNGCFCEKSSQRRKGKGKTNKKLPSKGGVPPVMFVSTLLRLLSTIVLLLRRKLGLIRKRLNTFEQSACISLYETQLMHELEVAEFQPVRYQICPYSPLSENRLLNVRRKIMVLDLDETLIHSHHDDYAHPLLHPDFLVTVTIDNRLVKFFVYKRPHVDFFLSIICQWYDLVVFTASMQRYGMEVANHLDQNKGILPRRYFRQDCTVDMAGYTKDLSMVSADLSNIFILDNSPAAYRVNPDNAIPIKSWFSDPTDTALLDLLPFLDALRFTHDVRSVLSRNLHKHNL